MKQKIIFVSQGLSSLVEQEHDASPLTETGTLVERRVDASFLFPPSLAEQSVFVSCQEPLSSSPLLAYLLPFWLASACQRTRSRKPRLQEKGKREGRLLLPLLRPRDCCHACVLSIIELQDEASVGHSNLDTVGSSKTSINLATRSVSLEVSAPRQHLVLR